MPRFVVDGRRYDSPQAVRADLQEAARALSRLRIPAEIEARRVGPGDRGPMLPSWREFRDVLALEEAQEQARPRTRGGW